MWAEGSLQQLGEGSALKGTVLGKGGRRARGQDPQRPLVLPVGGWAPEGPRCPPLPLPGQRASAEWAPEWGMPLSEAARLGVAAP